MSCAVNGRIEDLVHDAAVIPTDEYFVVEPHWDELLGHDPAAATALGVVARWRWPCGGWNAGLVHRRRRLSPAGRWTAWSRREACEPSCGRSPRAVSSDEGTAVPPVAVPVLGIGLGGLAGRQGEVVVTLLETLEHAVQKHEIDVAVVTPDRSVYAAVQHKRKSLRPDEASDRAAAPAGRSRRPRAIGSDDRRGR